MRASPLSRLAPDCPRVEVAGVAVAADHGDPRAEARAARDGAGVCDRSHRARLLASGPDALSFLQGQLSNDVVALGVLDGCLALALDGKGRLRSVVHASRLSEQQLQLECEGALAQQTHEHLDRYRIMEELELEPQPPAAALGVVGPGAAGVLAKVLGIPEEPLGEGQIRHIGALLLLGERDCGQPGVTLWAEPEELLRLHPELLAAGAVAVGHTAHEALRVEAGVPRWGLEIDEQTLPAEVGLERAVRLDKGCYTGQEVMARLHNFGHVNRLLMGLVAESDAGLHSGAEAELEGRPVGRVCSSVESPSLGRPLALAMLRREHAAVGTRLVCQGSAVEVVEPPLRRT